LGHIQRGGTPTALDRLIASKMGYAAVHALKDGLDAHVTAIKKGELTMVPLANCLQGKDDSLSFEVNLIYALGI
jgi:6-phosphofructokinase 1